MQTSGFFDNAGAAIGDAIHVVVTFLRALFDNAFGAIHNFFDGLSRSLGISGSFLSIIVLIIGLWLLFSGVRALLRGSIIGAIVRVLIGLLVLGWVMV
ncbi:MAG: hypothetical protein L0J54_06025 [Halomonas sp.]|nr:hypothetical protein [Halomonas sp.]MDN6297569.1 hypothetical protein [Halomonas sp.]